MARIYALNETHNCDYGVDFINGAAAVPNAKTDVVAWFTAKGYVIDATKDELGFWAKLTTAQLLEFATERTIAGASEMNKKELVLAIEAVIATIPA